MASRSAGGWRTCRASASTWAARPPTPRSALARLGLKPAMLTRVGDEHNGRFVRETLAAEGVDVSHVKTDPKRLTALVFLGIQDRETFPLVFYRDNCADMAIEPGRLRQRLHRLGHRPAGVGHAPVAAPDLQDLPPRHGAARAQRHARRAGHRLPAGAVGPDQPGHGRAALRAVGPGQRPSADRDPDCDLVVGTEEEIHIAGGSTDTLEALERLRELTKRTLVVKRGPMGCVVFDGAIPDDIEEGLKGPGFPVEVFNVLGAGDAFMAGFLRGWLKDEPLERCCAWANACGALVVSRHGCAPAMASWDGAAAFPRTRLAHAAPARRCAARAPAPRHHAHAALGRAGRSWPSTTAPSSKRSPRATATARTASSAFKQLIAEGARRGAGERAGRRRHPRRPLRRGRAARADRQGLVGRAPGRAARLAAAGLRSRRANWRSRCAAGRPSTWPSAW